MVVLVWRPHFTNSHMKMPKNTKTSRQRWQKKCYAAFKVWAASWFALNCRSITIADFSEVKFSMQVFSERLVVVNSKRFIYLFTPVLKFSVINPRYSEAIVIEPILLFRVSDCELGWNVCGYYTKNSGVIMTNSVSFSFQKFIFIMS